jgi:hypothetical protein
MPARSRFLSTKTNGGRERNNKLNNSHGIFAFRTLQGGMTSGCRRSRGRGSRSPSMTRRCRRSSGQGVARRGRGAGLFVPRPHQLLRRGQDRLSRDGRVRDRSVRDARTPRRRGGVPCPDLRRILDRLNDALQPGALYRECPMTALQVVETFKDKAPKKAGMPTTRRYEEMFTLYHAIEENDDFISPDAWAGRASRGARSIGTRTTTTRKNSVQALGL